MRFTPDEQGGTVIVTPGGTGASYTDAQAKDAAGASLTDSETIGTTYSPTTKAARFDLMPHSVTAEHLSPALLASGNLSVIQQNQLSSAVNWQNKLWIGSISGIPKNSLYADGVYLYYFKEDDYPVRVAL